MSQQAEDMLRRAFVDRRADYIVVTSRREQAQLEAVWYGEQRGWLDCEADAADEQCTAVVCRLTTAGREHFGLPVEREG